MNLLTRVLAMLVAATRAWWRRFGVANTARKTVAQRSISIVVAVVLLGG